MSPRRKEPKYFSPNSCAKCHGLKTVTAGNAKEICPGCDGSGWQPWCSTYVLEGMESFYHVHPRCETGRRIDIDYVLKGTWDRRRCPQCERLCAADRITLAPARKVRP